MLTFLPLRSAFFLTAFEPYWILLHGRFNFGRCVIRIGVKIFDSGVSTEITVTDKSMEYISTCSFRYVQQIEGSMHPRDVSAFWRKTWIHWYSMAWFFISTNDDPCGSSGNIGCNIARAKNGTAEVPGLGCAIGDHKVSRNAPDYRLRAVSRHRISEENERTCDCYKATKSGIMMRSNVGFVSDEGVNLFWSCWTDGAPFAAATIPGKPPSPTQTK